MPPPYNDDHECSDRDSFSDELSPTDGYFSPNQVPHGMILDPMVEQTSNTKGNKDKMNTQEAKNHPDESMHQTNTSAHTTRNPISYFQPSASSYRTTIDSPSHLHPISDQPPPAYIASIQASPVLTHGEQSASSYNTFLNDRLEEGTERQPQSMGGTVDNSASSERTPLWRRIPKEPSRRRTIIKQILAVVLIFAILAAVLGTTFAGMFDSHSRRGMPPYGSPIHGGDQYCRYMSSTQQSTYHIPSSTGLVVLQEFHNKEHSYNTQHVHTVGEVRIRKLSKDSLQGNRAHFTVDIKVSDPELAVIKSWDADTGTLNVSTPLYAHLRTQREACISLEITAWLPEDTELPHVFFDLVTLSIRSDDDVQIRVSEDAKLKTVSGHVSFANNSGLALAPISEQHLNSRSRSRFDSRRIIIETVSGRIEGRYPLYDLLKLSSASGGIGVEVYPEPVLKSAPAPATLDIKTASGRIEVRSPITIPRVTCPREYITRVASMSGAIQGEFYVGSTGVFETASGRIQLDIKPVIPATSDDDGSRNQLRTASQSGATQVTLLDPLFVLPTTEYAAAPNYLPSSDSHLSILTDESAFGDEEILKSKLRTFSSHHKTTSARMEIHYPNSWIGNIEATTISGRIEVDGEGIEIIRRNNGWGYKELKARKGVDRDEDGSWVKLENVNGAISFDITR